MTEARQHHYISQCYLKGFAERRHKNAHLHVWDLDAGRHFKSKPKGVASERDFNRIDAPGVDPNVIEQGLSAFEAQLDAALSRATDSRTFGADCGAILEFITLLFIRHPARRASISRFNRDLMRMMMETTLATEERWNQQKKQMAEDGVVLDDQVSYQDLLSFVKSGNYEINLHPTFQNKLEFDTVESIRPYIYNRHWTLYVAPADSAFITSDHPACLVWSKREDRGSLFGPGLALNGTTIVFPVSKDLALLGSFENQTEATVNATREIVEMLNAYQVSFALKQIYAPHAHFRYRIQSQPGSRTTSHLYADRRTMKAKHPDVNDEANR